jgi:hypothetical protein
MRAVFPFKRPERNAWLLAIPTLLIAFAVWIWVEPGRQLNPGNWVFGALMLSIRVRLRPGSLIPQGIDVAVCPA